MALPKIKQIYHRTKLFSDNKEVKFRPFTVGEQKQIMVIKETKKKESDLYKSIIDLTQGCVKT